MSRSGRTPPELRFDHDPVSGHIRHHAVALFLSQERRVLLVWRSQRWTLPSAHIRVDETADQAIRRAVRAELSLTVPILHLAFAETVSEERPCAYGVHCHFYQVYKGVLSGSVDPVATLPPGDEARWLRGQEFFRVVEQPWRRWLGKLHGEQRWR